MKEIFLIFDLKIHPSKKIPKEARQGKIFFFVQKLGSNDMGKNWKSENWLWAIKIKINNNSK